MQINFNRVDLAFEYRRVVFKWEGFSLKSFQNDTNLYSFHTHAHISTYIHIHIYIYTCIHIHVYIDT